MISRDPTLWYATIEVDRGSDDGVHVNDPVIGDGGLVGRISTVDPTVSIVTLITDHSMAVAAQIQDSAGDTGVLVPAVGDPNQLLVQDLPQTGPFKENVGQQVVTAGFKTGTAAVAVPARDPDRDGVRREREQPAQHRPGQGRPAGRPAPPRRRPGPDQAPRQQHRARSGAVNVNLNVNLRLIVRLVALGFATVVIQQAAVSQISIFGVSADLAPLVVMSVGLLAGSMAGAITGFGIGLFVDLLLVQTLGVTSLLYIAIGYGCGRLRELRDPAHGLVPLAMGAAATAFAGIGMALIQFLLGVNAPVSLLLLQQIFITVLVNTLIALPVYALVRRLIRPALPDDPRRRRRRAYTTGGLSPLQRPSERLGPIPRS